MVRAALLVPLAAVAACVPLPSRDVPPMPAPAAARTVLVVHGGAGVLSEAEMKEAGVTRADFEKGLAAALAAGFQMLKDGKTSTDAVEAAVRVLEDCEHFNAGRGAVLTSDGRAELDASIMEGTMSVSGVGKRDPRKRAGAVAGVTHVKNPISAARAVMEMPDSRHAFLVGEGAEVYALADPIKAKYKLERVSNAYFWTDRRLKQMRDQEAKDRAAAPRADALRPEAKFGTVGAVALDAKNGIAAGTSTGGVSGKWPGRVGDSPVIGAGTYADDRACGVSGTGTGEVFLRHAVAHDVVARMLYAKAPLTDAVKDVMAGLPDEEGGVGGLIALDGGGRHAFGMSAQCDGMYRGYVTDKGDIFVAVFAKDEWKPVK